MILDENLDSKNNKPNYKHPTIFLAVAIAIIVIAWILEVMHWPGSVILSLIGASLVIAYSVKMIIATGNKMHIATIIAMLIWIYIYNHYISLLAVVINLSITGVSLFFLLRKHK